MTMPVASELPVRLRWHEHLTARAAVVLARPLSHLSPRRLRQALEMAGRGARPASYERALRARRAVVTVSARCAGQGCLQRSIATALLCRLHGVWPDWCTGVRTQPFRAHAWVEVDGHPVGESGDTTLFHTVLSVRREVAP